MKYTQEVDILHAARYTSALRDISKQLITAVRNSDMSPEETRYIETVYDGLNCTLAGLEYRIDKLTESLEKVTQYYNVAKFIAE